MTAAQFTRKTGTTVIGGLMLVSLAIGLSAATGQGVVEAKGRRADDAKTEVRQARGADDTQPDDRGGQRGGNGADDTQPDDRGGHGADDGPNHS